MSVIVNVGCGQMYCLGWINIDNVRWHPSVQVFDLRKGLPCESLSVDFVYLSQVLEHFSRKEGEQLLNECKRILKKNGRIRICVPDLENIARCYVACLERARMCNSEETEAEYEWITLELLDQTTRTWSGGEIMERVPDLTNRAKEFVLSRAGHSVRKLMDNAAKRCDRGGGRLALLDFLTRRLRWPVIREGFVRLILRDEYAALLAGRFCITGELHRWMYDDYQLGLTLAAAGFEQVTRMPPGRSNPEVASAHFGVEDLSLYEIEKQCGNLIVEAVRR